MVNSKGLTAWILLALANSAPFHETQAAGLTADFLENVNAKQNGNISTRILSGWEARPGQHPHQVALRFVSRRGQVSSCGGVLIHEYWVLTAAHCTARFVTTVVRAGVTSLSTPEYISETTTFYNHPMYDWSRPLDAQPDDIALVRLRHPVPKTKYASPIRIQSRADAFRDYSGEIFYTSGFGRTWTTGPSPEVLQWVYLTAESNERCAQLFGDVFTDNSICAGPFNVTSQSVCNGDSGGPLVHVGADGIPTLVGITSFVVGAELGCHSGYPGAFIRPGPFLGWFREVTGIDFASLEKEEEEETTTAFPTTTQTPATTEKSETEPEQYSEEIDDSNEDIDEHEEESSEEDSSEEDPELKDLIKRLEVQVNVNIKMNKLKKRHEVHIKHDKRKKSKTH